MTESLHGEGTSDEHDHTTDGLVEVMYDNGDSVLFQSAVVQPATIDFGGVTISYEGLRTHEGFELQPYTIFAEEMALLDFGDSLEGVYSYEGAVGLFSKKHISDLGFLSIVSALSDIDPYAETERLKMRIAGEARQDTKNFPIDLNYLIEERALDVWVRLKKRQQTAKHVACTVVARLVTLEVAQDHETMIPFVDNYDGSKQVSIPLGLEFDVPWLYVGAEDDNP